MPQQAEPSRFQFSKFKIQTKEHREESRIKNFCIEPDLMARKGLELEELMNKSGRRFDSVILRFQRTDAARLSAE
ncbi:hypothetical protein B0A55_04676 [Friedmanniomyces simplex]|uniref:Uncharacterized protein n=1 Tax=Friedmanniomyces simplex TaxID=329884 RepID=A0A4U0Y3G3_9PEZI|nr:hypothetical protein B0A55_04676 [Friedmanniomyces simplex]